MLTKDPSQTYLNRLAHVLHGLDHKEIDSAIEVIAEGWNNGRQIIAFGNGGSAMSALHMVTDWNKGIFMATGKPFRGRTLVDNVGLIMAYGNDVSFEDIFIEQLKNILQPKDVVVAISGSGNSENVLRAVEYANEQGAISVGLCGFNGGRLKCAAHHVVHVESDDMQLCEDIHMIVGHIVMQRLCGVL